MNLWPYILMTAGAITVLFGLIIPQFDKWAIEGETPSMQAEYQRRKLQRKSPIPKDAKQIIDGIVANLERDLEEVRRITRGYMYCESAEALRIGRNLEDAKSVQAMIYREC